METVKLNPQAPSTWIPKKIFVEYCGGDDKLSSYYDKAVSKKSMDVFSYDELACFFCPAYFGYRGQWVLFVVFTILVVSILLICGLLIFGEGARFVSQLSCILVLQFFLGMMANGFLLNKAHQRYLRLKEKGLDEPAISEKMRNSARSVGGGILATFVFVVIAGYFYGASQIMLIGLGM